MTKAMVVLQIIQASDFAQTCGSGQSFRHVSYRENPDLGYDSDLVRGRTIQYAFP